MTIATTTGMSQRDFGSPVGPSRSAARPAFVPLPAPLRAGPAQVPSEVRPAKTPVLMRKVDVACMMPDGRIDEASRLVPALPAFEEAFAAFARGTLFSTDRGLQAVEDLWPGMRVKVANGSMQTLLWRGATMIVPAGQGQDPAMTRLTRIAADALGIARPMHDLIFGPLARMVHRGRGVRLATGEDAILVPASDLVDGDNIVEIRPASPVQVFHLGFADHERLLAHGVEVESQHPGPAHTFALRGDLLALWLSCFPHRTDLADFGPLTLPRYRLHDLDLDLVEVA